MRKSFLTTKQSILALSLLMAASFSPVSSIRYVEADTVTESTTLSTEATESETEETAQTEETKIVYSTADDLNLRKKASTDSKSLKKISAGTPLTVLSEEDDWYQVQSGKKNGYVYKLYVSEEWTAFSTTQNLNLRKKPSTKSEVVDQLNQGDIMTVLEKDGKWYKVKYGKKTGYVKKDYIDFQCTVYVDGSKVNVRKKANTEAKVLKRLNTGDVVTLLAKEGNWYKIRYNKKVGYIRDVYLTFTKPVVETAASSGSGSSASSSQKSSTSSSTSLGQSVVNYAKQFLGNPYVYGGTSLTNGADCSGFVQSVYAHFGISLPRTSSAQRSAGYSVGSLSEAKPGDLICYYGHVGIYIGNNAIIHASNEKSGIKITYNAAYRSIAAIRRVI